MSALVRLYPAAWRDRYEEEFLALLEARPPTPGDRFDIVRGAIDARLHPQVHRAVGPSPVPDPPANDEVFTRRLGYGSIVGTVVWIVTWVVAANGPIVQDGASTYRDGGVALPFLIVSIFLLVGGLVGHLIQLPAGRRVARIGAVIAIPFLLLWCFAPWLFPIGAIGLIGLVVFAIGAWGSTRWSRAASVAVLAGCSAVVALALVTAGIVAGGGAELVSQEFVLLLIAVAASPIWLGVGGTLVGARRPAAAG